MTKLQIFLSDIKILQQFNLSLVRHGAIFIT